MLFSTCKVVLFCQFLPDNYWWLWWLFLSYYHTLVIVTIGFHLNVTLTFMITFLQGQIAFKNRGTLEICLKQSCFDTISCDSLDYIMCDSQKSEEEGISSGSKFL